MQPSSSRSDRNTLSVHDTYSYPESSQSDDFAIIATPSPQPPLQPIAIIKHPDREETDEFHHVSSPHDHDEISNEHADHDRDRDVGIEDTESAELFDFHLVELGPDPDNDNEPEFEPGAATDAMQPSPKSLSLGNELEVELEQPIESSLQEIAQNDPLQPLKSKSNAYLEQALDSMQLSPSMSPRSDASASSKESMDEIISCSEPHHSSSDINGNVVEEVEQIADQIAVVRNETVPEQTPLVPVEKMSRSEAAIKSKIRRNNRRQREYERFVHDQSEDAETTNCTSYLCLKFDSKNNANRKQQIVENVSCFMASFTRYMDSCFGADDFTDDSLSSNAFYASKKLDL